MIGVVVVTALAGELLGSSSLCGGVEVLDLSLTKDNVGVAVGGLVNLGVVDDEEDLEIVSKVPRAEVIIREGWEASSWSFRFPAHCMQPNMRKTTHVLGSS